MRRLVAASAILAALLTWPVAQAAATPSHPTVAPSDSARATAALEYLLAAQATNGSIDGSLGETADYVIGAAAAGYDPSTLTGCAGGPGALAYLAAASDAASGDAAKTGKTILAVVAAGGDPSGFSGRDLAARLAALYHSATGAYGDGSTFSQSFAILARRAMGASVPAAATDRLLALQDPDGSWSFGTAPVAAGDGDTNSTAIALMALDSAGVHTADTTGLAYLKTQQLADGGFPYQNSSVWGPPVSDPDSDAIVLEAIVAAGENPTSAAWTASGGGTVLSHMRSTQGADGGFEYPGFGESAFTTSQIPAALMRAPYGVAVTFTPGRAVPTTSCPAASPSASPSSSGTETIGTAASSTPLRTATATPAATPTRRPTARPTDRPVTTPAPTPTPAPTDTPTPAPTEALAQSPDATSSEPATELVAGATAVSSATPAPAAPAPAGGNGSGDGGVPVMLLYLGAVLGGATIVAGGGWFLTRPGQRS